MWGFYIKHCNAVGIQSPERLLVENCHATGMSAECFYSASSSRSGNSDPAQYTKSIVYRNCTVADCARNAFNNNDMAENTAVLYCRIQDVGGCTWEGASRFVKFVGNYVRNAGTVAMGNIGSRDANFDILPSGQHIVAHNTFEQEMVYGGCAIRSCHGSTPVIIKDNIFVNFNTSAIEANGSGEARHLPAANTIISGNVIDLTCVRDDSRARVGIGVSADDTIVSDNQIYVRGDGRSPRQGHCPDGTGTQSRRPRQHHPRLRDRVAGWKTDRAHRRGDRRAHVQVEWPAALAASPHPPLSRLPDGLARGRQCRARSRNRGL